MASNPEFRVYEENIFVANGGEKILPFRPADGFILIKNRQIQYPTVDWFINTDGKSELKSAAVAGDTFMIINLASFLVSGAVTKEELASSTSSTKLPLFDLTWRPSRGSIVDGTVPADGQTLSRDTYPDAFAAIQAGIVPVCTDAEWLTDPTKHGFYTLGDGSTTFRVPDYNGKKTDALAAVVLRGDGKNAGTSGQIQQDCARNIVGEIGYLAGQSGIVVPGALKSAFFVVSTGTNTRIVSSSAGDSSTAYGIGFDSSRVVPTGPENRMTNVAGVWCIRLFNGRVLDGNVNISSMESRISTVEGKTQVLSASVVLQNGWRSFGEEYNSVTVRKINDIVYLDGLVKRDTAISGTSVLFTLPEGFRIAGGGNSIFPALVGANEALGRVDIRANGEVVALQMPYPSEPHVYLSLSGIHFFAS